MHVPLLARSCSPTFYLYRNIIFLSRKIKHVKIICVKFKTLCLLYLCKIKCYKALSSLQHIYFAFVISGQSSSLKATGYTGYNRSMVTTKWYKSQDKEIKFLKQNKKIWRHTVTTCPTTSKMTCWMTSKATIGK